MVMSKIKKMFNKTDEKYEIMFYKYSKAKLENRKLKEKQEKELREHKAELDKNVSQELIKLSSLIEQTRMDSHKVRSTDVDVQRLLVDINKLNREMSGFLSDFSIEQCSAKERFYDPELHEIASYKESKGMKKGIIITTARNGYKYKGKTIIKPRVVVAK